MLNIIKTEQGLPSRSIINIESFPRNNVAIFRNNIDVKDLNRIIFYFSKTYGSSNHRKKIKKIYLENTHKILSDRLLTKISKYAKSLPIYDDLTSISDYYNILNTDKRAVSSVPKISLELFNRYNLFNKYIYSKEDVKTKAFIQILYDLYFISYDEFKSWSNAQLVYISEALPSLIPNFIDNSNKISKLEKDYFEEYRKIIRTYFERINSNDKRSYDEKLSAYITRLWQITETGEL